MSGTDKAPRLDYLGDRDIADLTAWRRELHRHPELSGEEVGTAARIVEMLKPSAPDRLLTGLGGHGVAAVFEGPAEGPAILLRCDIDALPIEELGDTPHRSTVPGKAHLCGHDGHSAILAGVARWLGRNRPDRGRAILLFQPAEEDGSGAAKVIADPRFREIAPDFALALHNMPGVPLGAAVLKEGIMNCASRGMRIVLSGRTAHASQPETGLSPVPATAHLLQRLTDLGTGGSQADPGFSLVTVTHVRIGEPAFGIAPGRAELWATLRTQRDAGMDALVAAAETAVADAAGKSGLKTEITWHDIFRHCENEPDATRLLAAALDAEGIRTVKGDLPMRASEDFGRFGDHAKSAMLLLGAGEQSPALHNPDYDFPDPIIETGARIFIRCLRSRLF